MPRTPDRPKTPPDAPSHGEPPVQDPRTPPPHPIDPPARAPQVAGKTPAAPAQPGAKAGDSPRGGKVPPQPEGNRMMPSDNPEKGLNSYMDE